MSRALRNLARIKDAAEPPLDCNVGRDIVDRLRQDADINTEYTLTGDDVLEAAEEIVQLRYTIKTLNKALSITSEANARLLSEIDKLNDIIQHQAEAEQWN